MDFTPENGDHFGFSVPLSGATVPIPFQSGLSGCTYTTSQVAILGGPPVVGIFHGGLFPIQVSHCK